MIIIGAGMAGLLAAHMLRRHRPLVVEAQPSLPNNHQALLRFPTDRVGRATGIPFKRVHITKAVKGPAGLREMNQYAFKVTGEYIPRSIMNTTPGDRFISPPDFIDQMAKSLDRISYNAPLKAVPGVEHPTISTIPMPAMMDIVGWPEDQRPDFRWRPIWTLSARILAPKVDLYQTIYYPGFELWYRASFTGNLLTIESTENIELQHNLVAAVEYVAEDFGLPDSLELETEPRVTRQEYGKLAPVDEEKRRAFILALTDQYRIYSLGRFATWRQILLDDVVHDVEVIEQFITERGSYSRALAR